MSIDPSRKGQFVSQIIMTVDDSPSMRMLLRAALTDMGYRVLEAEDGVHALDTLDGVTADLDDARIAMFSMDAVRLPKMVHGQIKSDHLRVGSVDVDRHTSPG